MEKPPQTWRELLGNCMAEAEEGRRIASELGVNVMTLTRWVKMGTNPRPQTLRRLLNVLPQHRELLLKLIDEEFAGFSTALAGDIALQDIPTSIPSEFYKRVHHTCATLPKNLRFSSLCDLILQQALEQLDPQRLGIAIIVVRCMPPSQEQKIRSLLETVGLGTGPWEGNLEQHRMLLGAESLAGHAVSTCRLETNQNLQDHQSVSPGYRANWEESAVAAPILFMGDIAGSLLVSSTQPDYFVPDRCTLVESYAELMALAFASQDFYKPQDVQLDIMPTYEAQQSYLSGFRQLVIEAMSQAMSKQQSISYLQAEQLVWQQIENEISQRLYGA
jgi:transcriptional regulator with XRE-family HTH domain